MRYYIDLVKLQLIDSEDELSAINLDDKVDFHELCEHLNQREMEVLDYKRQLKNLKYKLRKLSE